MARAEPFYARLPEPRISGRDSRIAFVMAIGPVPQAAAYYATIIIMIQFIGNPLCRSQSTVRSHCAVQQRCSQDKARRRCHFSGSRAVWNTDTGGETAGATVTDNSERKATCGFLEATKM
jgi:hypothetical protein